MKASVATTMTRERLREDLTPIFTQIIEQAKLGKTSILWKGIIRGDEKDYIESIGYYVSHRSGGKSEISWSVKY